MRGRRGGYILDVVVFRLGSQQFRIPVTRVDQVFSVAEISPCAEMSRLIRGVVDVHGDLTPVIDLGRRVADAWTELHAEQQFILIDTATRPVILLADEVERVLTLADGGFADAGLTSIDDALATGLRATG
jgi:purine-binding chemotaxis protein CheW